MENDGRGRMLRGRRGLVRLGRRGKRFARDEENRAFCPLEQLRRHLTEEKLLARPWAHAHYQKIVTADLELTKNGLLRRANAAHCALYLDPIMISEPAMSGRFDRECYVA